MVYDRSGEMEKNKTEYEELSRSSMMVRLHDSIFVVRIANAVVTMPLFRIVTSLNLDKSSLIARSGIAFWFLICSEGRCIDIWDYRSKKLEMRYIPQSSSEPCFALSAKFIARKDWVVAGLQSRCILVYNYVSKKEVALFDAHTCIVTSVAVHPTLPYVLSSSSDSLIKLWDWENGWACTRVFRGHSSHITQVAFNPKNPHTFASASFDATIKVWNLGSFDPDFTLEGHKNIVNCVDYYTGDDKPYLISGSCDGTVKIWDYETKICFQTLEGPRGYVTTASFHPHLPIIVTGSYYGKVQYWDSITYRLDNVQDYGTKVGCIAYTKCFARVAIVCASVLIIVKIGRDRPVVSMDPKSGKILLAKRNTIQIASIRHEKVDYKGTDGERLSLAIEDSFHYDIYPQYMKHSRDGKCVVIGGDGVFLIRTRDALGWYFIEGYAMEFVWSSHGEYALRQTTSNQIQIFTQDFQVKKSYKPLFSAERIFGGKLLGIGCSKFICFFEWARCKLILRMDIARVENLYWAGTGDLVAITTPTSLFIFKYEHENGAFELVHEANESVKSGLWVNYNCFIYVNSSWRLNYCVGNEVTTFFHMDRPMYLLGYIASKGHVYLFDMEFCIVGCKLPLHLIKFKSLVMSGEIGRANAIVPNIPMKHRDSAARFVESKGMLEVALDVATNLDYRFELAIQLGRLEFAKEIASSEAESQLKWKLLGESSMSAGKFEMAEECLKKGKDISGLLLLYSSMGDAEGISRVATMAQQEGKNNVAFLCLFMLGRLEECLKLLVDSNRIPEAALMARSYLSASRVSTVVRQWREDRSKIIHKATEPLSDPEDGAS